LPVFPAKRKNTSQASLLFGLVLTAKQSDIKTLAKGSILRSSEPLLQITSHIHQQNFAAQENQ